MLRQLLLRNQSIKQNARIFLFGIFDKCQTDFFFFFNVVVRMLSKYVESGIYSGKTHSQFTIKKYLIKRKCACFISIHFIHNVSVNMD